LDRLLGDTNLLCICCGVVSFDVTETDVGVTSLLDDGAFKPDVGVFESEDNFGEAEVGALIFPEGITIIEALAVEERLLLLVLLMEISPLESSNRWRTKETLLGIPLEYLARYLLY